MDGVSGVFDAGVGEGGEALAAAGAGCSRREDAAALGDRIAEQAYVLDAALHRLLTDVRAFDAAGYWADEGAVSCAAWLSWRVGWTPGTGREHVRVARALGGLPRIDDALRDGALSYSKVRALTRVATPATEAALLNDARHATAAQLEIICRKLASVQRLMALAPDDVRARRTVTRRARADGMVVVEAVLPADEAAIVFAALEREAAACAATRPDALVVGVSAGTRDATEHAAGDDRAGGVSAGTRVVRLDRADGLVAMSQAVLRGDAPARSPVELVLTIGRDALAAESGADVGCFGDGTCVSAATARRLTCDCGVVEMQEGAAGEALSVGRKTRSVPTAIGRALARRDATCRFPGCTNRRFLDGHHLRHWIHGGETALDNMCRLCSHHHRFVHEHGYRVEWVDGELAFFCGARRVLDEPPRPLTPSMASAARRMMDAARDIDGHTGACGWNGQAVQYDWVVDELVRMQYRARA